ncbi:MAG: periplasmic binding protein-like I [Monoraphidium minutum]|nr:MAG: periplasmic binding protein-like I [Monoraphidium minutum]
MLIGDVCSAASLAATAVANKYQLPMVSPASTSTSLSTKDDYFYRTVPSDRFQGQYAASKLLELGLKKVVVAYSDESYGQGLSFAFIAAFTKEGGKVFPVPMPIGTRDTAAVMAEIKKQQPDGLFIASNNVLQGADLIKAVKMAKLPFKVSIFNGDSMMDPTVAATAGKANTVGVRGSDVSYGTPAFVADFKKFTAGKNISYVAKAAHAYDAAEALLEAYRRAPEPKEGPEIMAQLANVRFQGKAGPVAFDEYGDLKYDPTTSYDVSEFNAKGEVVSVEV